MMGLRLDRPGILLAAMALVVLAIVGSLGAMDAGIRASVVDFFGYGGPHADASSGNRRLFHSGVPIEGTKDGETYSAFDARRQKVDAIGFQGFGCIGDCSRHEAGYRWARDRQLSRARDCRGPTWEFVEGCAAYVLYGEKQ
jgi:hypothetical protein